MTRARPHVRGRAKRAFVFALAGPLLSLSGCTQASVLRGRIDGLNLDVLNAQKNGAMRCAPRELALAKSHLRFASTELDQGELSTAEAQLSIAEPNARAALSQSPPERCVEHNVAVVDKDTDGDHIPDAVDKCPNEPEDIDGFEDADGCPDPDNDNDTVPDVDDFCPNTPGQPGGAKPGCPGLVVVTAKEIRITQQIHFEFNKATIRSESFPILDAVVQVLKDNPKMTLEIQGHTDNVGTAAYNQKLSQSRADSVRTYLIGHDIESSRLRSTGYGLTQPIVPNSTEANRALNRRVQFIRTEATP